MLQVSYSFFNQLGPSTQAPDRFTILICRGGDQNRCYASDGLRCSPQDDQRCIARDRQWPNLSDEHRQPWIDDSMSLGVSAILATTSDANLCADTWFLVGLAARLAVGMGLHTASTYKDMVLLNAERRKRLFFSIYMMDR